MDTRIKKKQEISLSTFPSIGTISKKKKKELKIYTKTIHPQFLRL